MWRRRGPLHRPVTFSVLGMELSRPTLRLAVIVDQAFRNVSYCEPGVNQYNDPARNCQYVPRPRLMTQDELTTYCNGGGPFATVGHDVVRGGTIPDITAGAVVN
jgi:hypothetical protein